MKVQEKLTYDQYWNDARFQCKNLTCMEVKNKCMVIIFIIQILNQILSFKKIVITVFENGEINWDNYNRDIPGKYVLVSNEFWYWGGKPIDIPQKFLIYQKVKRQYILIKNEDFVTEFYKWLKTLGSTMDIYISLTSSHSLLIDIMGNEFLCILFC